MLSRGWCCPVGKMLSEGCAVLAVQVGGAIQGEVLSITAITGSDFITLLPP